MEKLNAEGMPKEHRLAKSIPDTFFGEFARKPIKADILGKALHGGRPSGHDMVLRR